MELVLKRGQTSFNPIGPPKFKLWTKVELTAEEKELVQKYRLREAIVYAGNIERERRRALKWSAGLAAAFTFWLYDTLPRADWFTIIIDTIPVHILLVLVVSFALLFSIIYHSSRETIILRDLIEGRSFVVSNIMDIAAKEQLIKDMSAHISQLLSDMKNWGGKELLHVHPLHQRYPEYREATLVADPRDKRAAA